MKVNCPAFKSGFYFVYAGKIGGKFEFWGGQYVGGTVQRNKLAEGTAENRSSKTKISGGEAFAVYGFSSKYCVECEAAKGDYYWTIKDFTFEKRRYEFLAAH